jgi:GTPase
MNDTVPDAGSSNAELVRNLAGGRKVALSRAITLVENRAPGFRDLLAAVQPHVGRAHRIGITGPPGAGKSTLVAALVAGWRQQELRVAVIAVDPTSPFTGGALLGDRIRMNEIALDAGVFIRSMATRGSVGGLALTTQEVADVMDAAGFDRILIETVGVGQTELDIARATDSTVVVLVPESGDGIQAMKAGLMEVSDLFVINKADRSGADRMVRDISMMLHLRAGRALRGVPAHHGVDLARIARDRAGPAAAPEPEPADEWDVPVLQTVASEGRGVAELAEALERHFDWLERTGERTTRRRRRLAGRVREVVDRAVRQIVWEERGGRRVLEENADGLGTGAVSPYDVAARIVDQTVRP